MQHVPPIPKSFNPVTLNLYSFTHFKNHLNALLDTVFKTIFFTETENSSPIDRRPFPIQLQ